MALLYKGCTCAISSKIIENTDSIIGFPAFPCTQDEPVFICYDAIVLREAFEKWEYRNEAQQRFADMMRISFSNSEFFVVLFESEEFLIARSLIEKNIRVYFLQEIFTLTVPKNAWLSFCDKVSLEKDNITLFARHSAFCFEQVNKNSAVKIWLNESYDGAFGKFIISMEKEKWLRFVSIVQKNKNAFMPNAG